MFDGCAQHPANVLPSLDYANSLSSDGEVVAVYCDLACQFFRCRLFVFSPENPLLLAWRVLSCATPPIVVPHSFNSYWHGGLSFLLLCFDALRMLVSHVGSGWPKTRGVWRRHCYILCNQKTSFSLAHLSFVVVPSSITRCSRPIPSRVTHYRRQTSHPCTRPASLKTCDGV